MTAGRESQKLRAKGAVWTGLQWSLTAQAGTRPPISVAAQPVVASPHACARPLSPRGGFGPGPRWGRLPGTAPPAPFPMDVVVQHF